MATAILKIFILFCFFCGALSACSSRPTQDPDHTSTTTHFDIEHWQTQNGAEVYFLPTKQPEMLTIRLIFDAASARDGDLPGLAIMTNALIGEGSNEYTASEIAKGFESLGAEFATSAHRDMAIIELTTLTEAALLNPSINLFTQVAGKPNFPQEAIDRIRNQILVGLKYEQQQPAKLISKAFFAQIYRGHPYGQPSSGTTESLKQITRSALQAFFKQFYVGNNLTVAMVGAINTEQAQELSEMVASTFSAGSATAALPAAPQPQPWQQHINFPSQQTHLMIGSVAVERNDKELIALNVGNEIFGGGGFSSILNKEIRQQRGLSYSVYSAFSPMQVKGPFFINLQTKTQTANEAKILSLQALQQFLQNGPSNQQLIDSKNSITGSFPLSVASNRSMVGFLGAMGYYSLPLDYLDQYIDQVNAVSAGDVKKAFNKHLSMDNITVITIGKEAATANLNVQSTN